MITIDEKLLGLAELYREKFDEDIPLRMLPSSITNDELCNVIEKCIVQSSKEPIEEMIKTIDKNKLI